MENTDKLAVSIPFGVCFILTDNSSCKHCGAPINPGDFSCGSCGASLIDQKSTQEQQRNTFGVLGLVFGILGLFIFSWLTSVTWLWLAFVFFVFCVLGVIFSSLSIRTNRTIGIVGLVLSTLASLVQIAWAIISIAHLL